MDGTDHWLFHGITSLGLLPMPAFHVCLHGEVLFTLFNLSAWLASLLLRWIQIYKSFLVRSAVHGTRAPISDTRFLIDFSLGTIKARY